VIDAEEPMTRDRLSELDCNYLDAQRVFMGSSDTGEYLERSDVAISSCGLRAESLNWGFLKPPYHDPPATAARVERYFGERKLPFQISFRSADEAACSAPLEAIGWRPKREPIPGMTLDLRGALPVPATSLEVETVRTEEQLVGFREVAFRAFGYPVAGAHLFLNQRLLALPQVALFAGRLDRTIVATSMLIATSGVAGIYWVATGEVHRSRGFGEALTWAAAAAGRERGCAVASLQASKLGRPVYERMGFAHVLDYAFLSPPDPS